MRYELLGPLRIVNDDGVHRINAPKVETLLAALLVRANRAVTSEELTAEIWGASPPRRSRAALHVYISQLRKTFVRPDADEAVIRTSSSGYVLDLADAELDVVELQRLHARGRAAAGRPEEALRHFTSAAELFRGPVLAGSRDGLIVSAFGRWADETRLECQESIARLSLLTGRHREVIGDLANWVDENPLHETLREQLMLALHRSGRRADALEVFQSARKVLRDELGLEPGDSLRRLQSAILDPESALSVAG
jgi:DNA-binding SARP family transcriptional activator